jgi:hypothetical protein
MAVWLLIIFEFRSLFLNDVNTTVVPFVRKKDLANYTNCTTDRKNLVCNEKKP